ncbi:unnamed protein product [Cylicocyclus nassatus]|uniref:Uncharacterized protein n=1 Tax=Cylicocyclus nassatus TaxID=53992 RepID=A0AA36M9E3_CYLNA|nr:unnamed protein product [Cylicocyclus nassatus]
MGEFVLDRLHPLLQQLVLCQRAKQNVKEIVAAIKTIIEAEWTTKSLHEQERAACKAAVLIALRVGAESSIATGTWSRDRLGYAVLVHALYRKEDESDSESALPSSIKFNHVHPLLSALLSNLGGDSNAIFSILQAVFDLCADILQNNILSKEILSPQHVALYGKLVSVCLEVVSDSSKDQRCRQIALNTLKIVVSASKEDSRSLCVVLPGLASTLASTLCKSSNEHLDIITTSLELFSMAVRFCLADTVQDDIEDHTQGLRPEIRSLLLKRDDEWKATSAANIDKIVRALCSNLTSHPDEQVRLRLLETIDSIRNDCKKAFEGTLDGLLMDLLLTVRATSSRESEIANKLRSENLSAYSLHMHEKLRELAERIPVHVRKGTTGSELMFHQLAGVLRCLDVDVSRLATSRAPSLQALFSALATSLRVDARRLLISRGQSHTSSNDFLKSLPLCFDVQIAWLLPICKLLAEHGGIEVVDIAVSELADCSMCDRASMAIPIALILAELKPQDDSHVLYFLAEMCIEWIKDLRPEEHTRDDVLEHKIPAPSEETIQSITLISLLAVTFTSIKEESKRRKLLVEFLYELLGLYAISNWIVHDAADCALNQFATGMSLSISEFLFEHGSYIVHHIALAARSRKEHDHAPVVFTSLLDRVDDSRMYEHVRHIVEDLLQALDRFKQTYSILILRSMLAFVTAVGRWYPDLKPVEEEESSSKEEELTEEQAIMDTEKKPPPMPILSVEAVLTRTKHLLSSPHYPVRMLVMRILREALWVVRNFDDQLLPMVHQNWETLINRFRDEELEVRQEAIKVVAQMVRVSKTFVYRRVRHQLWPLIEKWMLDASNHKYSPTSAAYKYQLSILQNIAGIFIGIDAFPEDMQLVLTMLDAYTGKTTSPQLKKEAENSKKQLEEYLETKKREDEERKGLR